MPSVLLVHNHYLQRGGEDAVFDAERSVLHRSAAVVGCYETSSTALESESPMSIAARSIWNRRACDEIVDWVRSNPDPIVHVHNTFPVISPAVIQAAHSAGAAVVVTVHNQRMVCANGLYFRDGAVCTECRTAMLPWPAIQHRCYRGSVGASAAAALMISVHRLAGTWRRHVSCFIAPSDFMRQQLMSQGIDTDAVVVKPHFLPNDPGVDKQREPVALFVGRLSAEKGIATLLEAWSQKPRRCTLKIIGEGPMRAQVEQAVRRGNNIEYLGAKAPDEVFNRLRRAQFVLVPSSCFESFGRTVIEAYATGTPVIAARSGALVELIAQGETGLLFEPDQATPLSDCIDALDTDEPYCARMGATARARFLRVYTVEPHVHAMAKIYQRARERRKAM